MKPITKRIGRRLVIYSKHSTMNGKRYQNASGDYENYELTFYENCISIRQHSDETGSYITWMPLDDILSINEFQAEGCQPIELSIPRHDWPASSPQK
jgi:hypothetical protein